MISWRSFLIGLGAIAAITGFIVLALPIKLNASDQQENQITCGTGYKYDVTAALREDDRNRVKYLLSRGATAQTNYLEECNTESRLRRAVGMPLAAVGVIVLIVGVIVQVRRRPQPPVDRTDNIGHPEA